MDAGNLAIAGAAEDVADPVTDDAGHFVELATLEAMIERVSKSTNEYLLQTIMGKYQLLEHCRALKCYMLLGQGDFIQYLMDLLDPELSKQAAQIYRHNLTNVLETALNSSNAKFEVSVAGHFMWVVEAGLTHLWWGSRQRFCRAWTSRSCRRPLATKDGTSLCSTTSCRRPSIR